MEHFCIYPRFKDAAHFQNYWKKGNGRELKEWSGAKLSLDGFEEQSQLYFQVDELGDQIIQDFYLNQSYQQASQRLENCIRKGIEKQNDVPESVKRLFGFTEKSPDWLDRDLLNIGAETSMRVGRDALITLRDYSLMGGYDYAYLNKPLVHTGALRKGAFKRLSETLNFWVNVTRKNAMNIHDKGYESAIKTRMIHSFARYQIKKHVPNWDVKEMGEPINLWDMTATSNGFSLILLHGIKKLGNEITPKEELGVFHLWKYISYLMGVPAGALPNNAKEAVENFYRWTSVQPPADEDSVFLAQSLVNESLENPVLRFQFQRNFLNYIHVSSSKFLLDDEVFERLELPKVWNAGFIPNTLKTGNKVRQKVMSREKLIEKGDKIQQHILKQYLEKH
ncbi:DUF2236 domain-containing protein [Brumimicrobium salinarum]|uniref:DUF2236 domain-containing protein n=1 Tax=Brumimicrobium salinarum TaxID=2058658 RepID=A0A2I0R4C6_9FLAO|nr:oxygenase MpaB family protein [Brumimicrobium salinarum]PKR81418.1 DUF2236 domain-containing protein [Brumimicrobium salinarum]